MPGLHLALLETARAAGVPLSLGRPLPWLTGRGHLNDLVRRAAPADVLAALTQIHVGLGGDAVALGQKRAGNPLTPDLVHTEYGCLVEVDEVQHFTTARLQTLEFYPPDSLLGFDPVEYRDLIHRWRTAADRAYAHRVAVDFPQAGGRQAQRAYNDALRDLLAPTFASHPVIRIPVPDRSLDGAVDRLNAALGTLIN